MRLICPNCGAQYEVPDEVIPESGRDVQCSNCGDTWFQPHPSQKQEAGAPAEFTDETEFEDEADWALEPDEDDEEDFAPGFTPAEEEAAAAEERRRALDPDVASLLREEAEREAEARAAEGRGAGLETQPDLGLSESEDEADKRSHQAKARMARLRGMATPTDAVEDDEDDDIDPGSRRDLLPDIEEINSSISTHPEDGQIDRSARDGTRVQTGAEAGAGGFRRGLRLAVVLAIILTALYMFAPQIAGVVPQAAGPLSSYVAAVDAGRVALEQSLGDLPATLRALIGR
ncbi:MAG: zinc-ribbon domain-containing protein [Roseovarius sp.]